MSARGQTALVFSWLLLILLIPVARRGWFWSDLRPSLPLVSLPDETTTDIASSVPLAVTALAVATICALIGEVAKFDAGRTVKPIFYFAIVAYQAVLVMDGFRSYAYDWWLLILSLTGWFPLRAAVDLRDVSGVRVPWLSGVMLIALLAAAWLRRRAAPRAAPP